jgi:hypothetical protein
MELEDSPPSPAMYGSMDSKDLGFIFFPSLSREFLGVSCPTYLPTYFATSFTAAQDQLPFCSSSVILLIFPLEIFAFSLFPFYSLTLYLGFWPLSKSRGFLLGNEYQHSPPVIDAILGLLAV